MINPVMAVTTVPITMVVKVISIYKVLEIVLNAGTQGLI